MAVKITDKTNVPELLNIINELNSKKLLIGVFGGVDSFLVEIAYANEFGLTITPKNAKNLAIPVSRKSKGKRPRDFSNLEFIKVGDEKFLVQNKRKRNGVERFEVLFVLVQSVNIPERSFIRASFDANMSKIENYVDRSLSQIFNFQLPVSTFYEELGAYCTSLIKKYMTDLKSPPNSSLTQSMKGFNNPLINTGRLRNSITFKVI